MTLQDIGWLLVVAFGAYLVWCSWVHFLCTVKGHRWARRKDGLRCRRCKLPFREE